MKPTTLRSLSVAAAVGLAILVPALVMGLHLGLNQAQFAAQGDLTLRAAPYAFAIWGAIYLGLIAYAADQWRRDSVVIRAFGWPSVVAATCCAGWIVTTAVAVDLRGRDRVRRGGRGLAAHDRRRPLCGLSK